MIQDFKLISKKGEGTFSEVLKCQHIKTKEYFACKKMKQHYESWDKVNNLREIQAMRRLNPHDHILSLHEVIFDPKTGTLCLILELMDMNLYEVIKGRKNFLPESLIKFYAWQLLNGLQHIHNNGIFHRDVKPENILIRDKLLKIADFGSCKSIFSRHPYTEYISTRWYRAPECLLTDGYYSFPMDLWSVGCVLFEILSLRPLFPGANEVDQIAKIHEILGTPDQNLLKTFKKSRSISFNFPQKKGTGFEKMITNVSHDGTNLIRKLLEYDPQRRLSSQSALQHPYFKEFRSNETMTAPNFSPSSLSSPTRYYNGISSTTASSNAASNITNQHKKPRKASINHIPIDSNKENLPNQSQLKVVIGSKDEHSSIDTGKTSTETSNSSDKISQINSKSPALHGLLSPNNLVNKDPLSSQNNKENILSNRSYQSKDSNSKSDLINSNKAIRKKKPNRYIHENSNSKPWISSTTNSITNSSSFLPKIYITNNNPYITNNSNNNKNIATIYQNNPYLPSNNDEMLSSRSNYNKVFKYSKYYPKNKNAANVAQIHRRFQLRPAFR